MGLTIVSRRVAFISPTGFGNLGDAAIVDSLLHGIRRQGPGAEIVGFTQKPADTRARHGIPAFTLSGLNVAGYRLEEPSDGPDDAEGDLADRPRKTSAARRAIAAIPGARRAVGAARLALAERRHRQASAERIDRFDTVVVAGGGQLDAFWGGPFGHPYTLWRWGQLAHATGARFVILSVGTGTLASPLSALFVRRALALADYRSFRDAPSRDLVGAPELTRDAPVVPDLAFGLPLPVDLPSPDGRAIGISPMAYADPRVWPEPDRERYRRHIDSLAELTVRIVKSGLRAVLFTSDSPDRAPLEELRARAEAALSPDERARIQIPVTDSVGSLIRVLAGCALVVAARLHGVLLANVVGRPALAISHERKVRTLMTDMGHAYWCFEIDDFSVEAGFARFRELHARHTGVAAEVARAAADCRRRVDAQYDRIFGGAA
jgi:polysaccharide pyruvyl transferase WcaK-like protein